MTMIITTVIVILVLRGEGARRRLDGLGRRLWRGGLP